MSRSHTFCGSHHPYGRPSGLESFAPVLDWAPGQAQNIFALDNVPLSPRANPVVEQGLPSATNPGAGDGPPRVEEQVILSPTSPADPEEAPRGPFRRGGPAPVDEGYRHAEATKTLDTQPAAEPPAPRPLRSIQKGLPSRMDHLHRMWRFHPRQPLRRPRRRQRRPKRRLAAAVARRSRRVTAAKADKFLVLWMKY